MGSQSQAHSSRADVCEPELNEGRSYYSLLCKSRQRNDKKMELIVRRCLEQFQSKRGETKSIDEVPEATATQTPIVKSIMKSGDQARQARLSVKFVLPEKTRETSRRPAKHGYFARCLRFLNRPTGRIITSIVCCVVLPCSLIYAAVFISARYRPTSIVASRGKSVS